MLAPRGANSSAVLEMGSIFIGALAKLQQLFQSVHNAEPYKLKYKFGCFSLMEQTENQRNLRVLSQSLGPLRKPSLPGHSPEFTYHTKENPTKGTSQTT